MSRRCFHNALVAVLVLLHGSASVHAAEPTPELLDLAGRIEFGFYTQEERALEAARAGFSRLSGSGGLGDYYAGLAAYRAALLAAAGDAGPLTARLTECRERGRKAAESDVLAGESWVLVAACAVLGARHEPSRVRLYQRQYEEALSKAVVAQPRNPRIAVVRAWAISHRPAHEDPALRDRARAHLEHALEQFATWDAPFGHPDWGEAEAMAHLGEIELEAGNARAARDFIERALLLVPDYRFALGLQKRVLSSR